MSLCNVRSLKTTEKIHTLNDNIVENDYNFLGFGSTTKACVFFPVSRETAIAREKQNAPSHSPVFDMSHRLDPSFWGSLSQWTAAGGGVKGQAVLIRINSNSCRYHSLCTLNKAQLAAVKG